MTSPVSAFLRRVTAFVVVCSLVLFLSPAYAFQQLGSYENNRARLLGYMLKQDLAKHHFTHKTIDDSISKAAFGLFMKQLDGQKRFLLKADVQKLKAYADRMDDEISSGKMTLAEAGPGILDKRLAQVRPMVTDLLSRDFDFSKTETIETDPEKLDYCANMDELKERWRKTLKFQVLQRYLMLKEDEAADEKDKTTEKQKAPEVLQSTAREKVLKEYEAIFARMLEEKERERYDRFFNAIARAFDPHTEYMPPANKEDFDISMRGSLEGIGATLQEEDGYIKVVGVVPGGPAFRQKQLHPEDIILKVAEGKGEPVDITNMRVKDAVKLIRGKKGTEVRLTVKKPDGTRIVIPIVRDVVQLEDSFVKGMVLQADKDSRPIGYLKIPSFYRDFSHNRANGPERNVTDDVRRELKDLESHNIKGLVVDLRNDGGGALTDAVNITGLFVGKGPVVQVKNSEGRLSVLSNDDAHALYGGPLVVLVNKFSASASEIVAGALQDYGRAVIIGSEHTHGKGTVQSIIDLDDSIPFGNMEEYRTLGALKLTIQKFYRISGESTQYRGVLPDIVLPDRFSYVKSGEKYLDFALPWDTVAPAHYNLWRDKITGLPELRAKSRKRVEANKDFMEIDRESRIMLERQKKTLQSLNIDVVRKEREEALKLRDAKDFHGIDEPDKNHPDKVFTREERRALWEKDVNGDIYVREAAAVLDDMISLPDGPTSVATNSAASGTAR